MLFSRKKKTSALVVTHYEGLQGFNQDFPCTIELGEEGIIFGNNEGRTIGLAYSKLQNIESMPEVNFMGKYHNNPVNTAKMGVKWFFVIHYISSLGEMRYIALWGVGSKVGKLMDEVRSKITYQVHVEL